MHTSAHEGTRGHLNVFAHLSHRLFLRFFDELLAPKTLVLLRLGVVYMVVYMVICMVVNVVVYMVVNVV